jgi:transposase
MPRPAPLPSDVESLQRLVREQQAQLLSRDVLIEQLKLQLARLKKMKFGRSSEQLDAQIAQLEFSLEELEANAARLRPLKLLPVSHATKPRASPYPIICPASLTCTSPQQDPAAARSAAGSCARWARILPRCSSMYRSTGR